jgi:hypothetical protein
MKFAKFVGIVVSIFGISLLVSSTPTTATETAPKSCTSNCKPAALPSVNSVVPVNNSVPISQSSSNKNDGSFSNYNQGGSSVSNNLGLSFGGQVNPATFNVSGECSLAVGSQSVQVGATVNGAQGSFGGGGAVGWNSISYNNPPGSEDACVKLVKLKVEASEIRTINDKISVCIVLATQRSKGIIIDISKTNPELANFCQSTSIVVEAPPAPAPVVVIQQPPVQRRPVEYPTAPATGNTGSH